MSNSSHPNEPSMVAVLEAIHQYNQLFQRSQEQMMQTLTSKMEQLATNTRTVATKLPTRLEQHQEDRQFRDSLNNRWDGGFREEIPEFAGGLKQDSISTGQLLSTRFYLLKKHPQTSKSR
jgi:hypothetical protein